MDSFSVETVVRGFHVYKEVWDAAVGEELSCRRDIGNACDPYPYAVAMVRAPNTVGHVPRRVCSIFLRRGRSITCTFTGSRHYSGDLPQGGLEVPCLLKFVGDEKQLAKAKKLINSAMSSASRQDGPAKGKRKVEDKTTRSPANQEIEPVANPDDASPQEHHPESKKKKLFHITGQQLHEVETSIIKGNLLSDLPVNLAQHFLQSQFPQIEGLQYTTAIKEETIPR